MDRNWKVGVPSGISVSVHPPISALEPPVLVIWTYSSDSEVGTTPSQNMQEILRAAGGGEVGVEVGDGVGNTVGVAVGRAVGFGVTVGGSDTVVGLTVGGRGVGVGTGGLGIAVAVGATDVAVGTITVATIDVGGGDAGSMSRVDVTAGG